MCSCVCVMSDIVKRWLELWITVLTLTMVWVGYVQHISCLVMCMWWALRRLMAMQKVKWEVCLWWTRSGEGERGGLDQGTEGWRMNRGWLAPRGVDKKVYMQGRLWRYCCLELRRLDQVKARVWALSDQAVEDEWDMRRSVYMGPSCFGALGFKTAGYKLVGFGLQNPRRILGQHVVSLVSMRRGEASSWNARSHSMLGIHFGPLCTVAKWFKENT